MIDHLFLYFTILYIIFFLTMLIMFPVQTIGIELMYLTVLIGTFIHEDDTSSHHV